MARFIPLRSGGSKTRLGCVVAVAVIDDCDYERLSPHRWSLHKDGYAVRTTSGAGGVKRRTVLMHREIMGLEHGDDQQVDHIDRDRLNNQRSNLRMADALLNGQNKSSFRGSSSRFRGVSWMRDREQWVAYVTNRGKRTHLGFFEDEDAAGAAAREARERLMPGVC